MIKVDLPEPLTPVTTVNMPIGNFTLTFCKLFSLAPRISIQFLPGLRRSSGSAINLRPLKYCPVIESSTFMTSSTVPAAMICPPCSPAPGPISTK